MRKGEALDRAVSPCDDGDASARSFKRVHRPVGPAWMCSKKGCANTTADRKPYCLEHLRAMPYYAKLARAAARDAIGICAKDIVALLKLFRTLSVKRLRLEAGSDASTFAKALWRLTAEHRIVTFEVRTPERGHVVVCARLRTT